MISNEFQIEILNLKINDYFIHKFDNLSKLRRKKKNQKSFFFLFFMIWKKEIWFSMTIQGFTVPYLYDKTVNGHEKINVFRNILTLQYPCENKLECSPYVLTLKPGRYMFEVWGAQGGGNNTGIPTTEEGGKGGYSKGKFHLQEEKTFYIYIGSSGTDSGNGGFNGGGALGSNIWLNGTYIDDPDNNTNLFRAPGGGATDIRLIPGNLVSIESIDFNTTYFGDEESLNSRILVAGGGGGNSIHYGFGGGETGSLDKHPHEIASSGNQTKPGITYEGIDAGFGYGGFTNQTGQGISGGGGGYFGGGGASHGYGGSGFINTSFFYTGSTIKGNEQIPSPYNINLNEIGHSGDGMARITYFDYAYICTCQSLHQRSYLMFTLISILSSNNY